MIDFVLAVAVAVSTPTPSPSPTVTTVATAAPDPTPTESESPDPVYTATTCEEGAVEANIPNPVEYCADPEPDDFVEPSPITTTDEDAETAPVVDDPVESTPTFDITLDGPTVPSGLWQAILA